MQGPQKCPKFQVASFTSSFWAPCKAPSTHYAAKSHEMIWSGALQGAQKELVKFASSKTYLLWKSPTHAVELLCQGTLVRNETLKTTQCDTEYHHNRDTEVRLLPFGPDSSRYLYASATSRHVCIISSISNEHLSSYEHMLTHMHACQEGARENIAKSVGCQIW